jgi:hypothetical protein
MHPCAHPKGRPTRGAPGSIDQVEPKETSLRGSYAAFDLGFLIL